MEEERQTETDSPVKRSSHRDGTTEPAPIRATARGTYTEATSHPLGEDYAVHLTQKNSKEVLAFQESIEEMLIRLDEFCGMLDMIRSDSTELLAQHIPCLRVQVEEMKNVYTKIDKIEAFVGMVAGSVAMLEMQVLEVERGQSCFPQTVHKVLQTFRSPGVSQKDGSETEYPYELPSLFRTEEYFAKTTRRTLFKKSSS
ncbi:biogenesis of lysosome-related organelles complex 1 subunit 4 [Lepisosteus oculatus]|uniref:biogenesis of lysosome-related organelles complex 1 subunit 4 n=1 Tax=Lepisosteus oculatus TaxID=7918 RepID=UPI00073FC741|nr:PREDICTED: breast carcinoma-amplified sequence 4 [Lepisosteus oculatus]